MASGMTRRAAMASVLVLSVGVTGCQVDPSGSLRQTVELVSARTGAPQDWRRRPADAWDGRSPLTRAQAVEHALAGNPQVQAEFAEIVAAEAELVQAGLLPNPTLSTMLGFAGGSLDMVTAGAMQSLSALWLRPARREAAQADLQRTVLSVANTALNVAAEAQRSHHRVVNRQYVLTLLEQQQAILRRSVASASERLKAGIGTSLDVNRLTAESLQNEVKIADMRTQLRLEKLRLLELMGLADLGTDWQAAGAAQCRDPLPPESDLVTLALAQRLDVQAGRWAVRVRQGNLRQARLGALPELSAGGNWEREGKGSAAMDKLGPAVTVTVPIFDQNQARAASARAGIDRAVARLRLVEQQAVREVRQALQEAHTAEQQRQVYAKELVPLAERNLRDTGVTFDAGQVDVLDVLESQRSLLAAQVAEAELAMEAELARIGLWRACGGLLPQTQAAPTKQPATGMHPAQAAP
ncbi:MAG: TolC family protein [Planctomycetes bacterium]|nr:TolC family protein [Planctomycetota bacterium]